MIETPNIYKNHHFQPLRFLSLPLPPPPVTCSSFYYVTFECDVASIFCSLELKIALDYSQVSNHPFLSSCSATWPDGVQRLATRYMKNPIHVSCVLDLAACHTVTQYVEYIDEEYKRDRLYEFITQEINPKEKCLIFVGRKAL